MTGPSRSVSKLLDPGIDQSKIAKLASQIIKYSIVYYITVQYSTVQYSIVSIVYTSYAMLSSGLPWNMPRVTCVFRINTSL